MASDPSLPYFTKDNSGKIPENKTQMQVFAHEHLRYEVWMLCEAFKRWCKGGKEPDPEQRTITVNLLLESVAMHARLLHEFFDEDSVRREDAKASDFRAGAVPHQRQGDDKHIGETAKGTTFNLLRANREIVHLSYFRFYGQAGQKSKKGWELTYLPKLETQIRRFLAATGSDCIAPATKKEINAMLEEAKFSDLCRERSEPAELVGGPITTLSSGAYSTPDPVSLGVRSRDENLGTRTKGPM